MTTTSAGSTLIVFARVAASNQRSDRVSKRAAAIGLWKTALVALTCKRWQMHWRVYGHISRVAAFMYAPTHSTAVQQIPVTLATAQSTRRHRSAAASTVTIQHYSCTIAHATTVNVAGSTTPPTCVDQGILRAARACDRVDRCTTLAIAVRRTRGTAIACVYLLCCCHHSDGVTVKATPPCHALT